MVRNVTSVTPCCISASVIKHQGHGRVEEHPPWPVTLQTAKEHNNVIRAPMLGMCWSLAEDVVPPPLHVTALGLGSHRFTCLEGDVARIEGGPGAVEATLAAKELKTSLAEVDASLKRANHQHTSALQDVENERRWLELELVDRLVASATFINSARAAKAYITKGRVDEETFNQLGLDSAAWKAYETHFALRRDAEERVETTKTEVAELKEDKGIIEGSLTFFREVVLVDGPVQNGLVPLLAKFGADMNTYNGAFIGRHLDALVANINKVFDYLTKELEGGAAQP